MVLLHFNCLRQIPTSYGLGGWETNFNRCSGVGGHLSQNWPHPTTTHCSNFTHVRWKFFHSDKSFSIDIPNPNPPPLSNSKSFFRVLVRNLPHLSMQFCVGSIWCIATPWFSYTSTVCARSQPPLTLSRSFSITLHFLHSLGPFTLNFVSSTLTLWRAKCQPHAVDHSSNGMLQLAQDTQCLTRPCLFLEMAQSFCFSFGGLTTASLLTSLFLISSVRITLTSFTSLSCFSASTGFSSPPSEAICLLPCCLTFTGSCSNASVIYLMTADDFHLPKKAISNKGNPCLAYIMAPDLLPECPVALASRNFCQKNQLDPR